MAFTPAAHNPYELWSLHKSIGVMRDVRPAFTYWSDLFTQQVESTDEWIDFEKLPALNRRIAPFVRPLATGKPIYTDSSTGFRFKPAYTKVKDTIDSTRPLTKIPGIDAMLSLPMNDPMARREALKVQMTIQHVNTIQRLWEWMAARAIIDGKITVSGEDYPTAVLDFNRDAGQTVVLTSGSFWGDSGVSIMDFIQTQCDLMIYPVGGFGGFPQRITLGSRAWAILRKDPEIKDLMNLFFRNPGADVPRGLIPSDKVTKVGELPLGGASGASIELWLYRDSYTAADGVTEIPLMNPNDVVFTASPDAMTGYRCFGAIADPFAEYQPLPIFARNWMESGDPAGEHLLHQSAPLFVPVNPNASLKATVCA